MGQGNPKADPKAPEHHDVPAPDSDRHTAAKPIAGAKKPTAHAQSPHAGDGGVAGGGGGGIPGGPDGGDGDVAMGQAGAVVGAGVGMGTAMGAGAMRADVDERGLPMGTPSSLTDRVARFLNKAGPPNAAGAAGQVPVGSVGAGAVGLSASPKFDDLLVPEPKQIETVSTLFKWTGGGSEVFLTGSFNNWQGKIRMQRNAPGASGAAAPSPNTSSNALVLADSASSAAPTRVQVTGAPAPAACGQPDTAMALLTGAAGAGAGAGAGGGAGAGTGVMSTASVSASAVAGGVEFALVIDIPPGIHQYKYIVDEQWRINPDAPTTTNAQGVVNNIIEVKRPVFEDNLSAFADSDEEELDENKQKIAYGQRVPAPDEYAKEPPKIPPQLGNILLNAPVSPADPYLLPTPQHVTLNHMYVYGYGKSPGESEVLVTGITQRFKTKSFINATPKFVTTVFYSPKPQIAF